MSQFIFQQVQNNANGGPLGGLKGGEGKQSTWASIVDTFHPQSVFTYR